MPQKCEKLKTLLKELLQLDQPDLDFGLYRIMHAKAAEVTQFLDKDLLPQVKEAFDVYKTADKAEPEKELAKVIAGVEAAGMDPQESPKVREERAKVASDAVDLAALENEVYDHLYSFFRRYYSEGDFLAKRVYKPGVYAIPYEGEEVKLHWANADQYYIKTSEYLWDYAFRLRPEDEQDPMRVHFRLVDAAEGEHGNVKAAEGKDRVFLLASHGFAALADGDQGQELIIDFEYRPATLADWPAGAAGKTKPPTQKDMAGLAEQRILAIEDAALARWIAELAKPHAKADGERDDYCRLRAHLNRYVGRNTFDCFIHKDLGGFLRRELDFYIKNEVMHLDDVENESVPCVEQYLSKIRAVRRIAGKIIAFLAQLEDFQKKLWLKKKFVTQTSYCVRLDAIPEALYPEIAANDPQRDEWVRLCAIDELKPTAGSLLEPGRPGYRVPLTTAFLKAYPTLMMGTHHFEGDFVARLLGSIDGVDEQVDGVLVHSENFQALSLVQTRYREQIKCLYIDPPYNTGGDGFAYKDAYQHSSWYSMAWDRIARVRPLLMPDGALFVSIDENEQPGLRQILNTIFGAEQFVADMVWAAGRKNDSRLISISHEYVVSYANNRQLLTERKVEWRQRKKGLEDIYAQHARLQRKHGTDYSTMTAELKTWFAALPDNSPAKAHRHYCHVDSRGVYFPDNISWPGGGGPTYEVLHPETGKPVRVPSRGWMTSDPKKMAAWIADDLVHFGVNESSVPCLKSYLKDREYQAPYSVFYQDGRAATKRLRDILGSAEFGYPKDEEILQDVIDMVGANRVLDYFAGSGATGHAVINLNREDGCQRKFILVEQADYFDTVLVPRLKKVTFTPEWKDGRPKRLATAEETERSPRVMKIVRLESYEDALNNLELRRTAQQQNLLELAAAQGADRLREQYMLRYLLDVEARGSQSLLNVAAFIDPTAYKLKVKRAGSDESREVNVDLLETFNWLIGLTVHHIAAPQTFSASFERDSEKRLRLKPRIKQIAPRPGPLPEGEGEKVHWFRTVTGTAPDGRKTLIIWRKRPGGEAPEGIEQDNLVLDEWFTKQGYSSKDSEFDLIYVNASNNLENLKAPDDTWKVRLIEEDFHRLMFETED